MSTCFPNTSRRHTIPHHSTTPILHRATLHASCHHLISYTLTTSPPHRLTSPPHHLTSSPPHLFTSSPLHHLTTSTRHHLTTSPPHLPANPPPHHPPSLHLAQRQSTTRPTHPTHVTRLAPSFPRLAPSFHSPRSLTPGLGYIAASRNSSKPCSSPSGSSPPSSSSRLSS